MIPIVTISGIILFFFILFMTARIYASYRKTKSRTVGYFVLAFLPIIVQELIFMPNGILVKDPVVISAIFNLMPLFYFISISFFTAITLEILNKPLLKKISFVILVIYGIIMSYYPIVNLKPAIMTVDPPFVFWEDSRGPLINNLVGIGMAIPILWFIIFFIYNGVKASDRYVRNRSFILSGAMTCYMLSGVTDFIFGANPNMFYVSLYTVLVALAAIFLFLFSVRYKEDVSSSFGERKAAA
jgi:hypothetical protein